MSRGERAAARQSPAPRHGAGAQPPERAAIGDNPPMKLRFTKMQGAGNDFVVVDGVSQAIRFSPEQWRRLADRHFGVGADQLLLVERPGRPDVDFRYRIFNADGGEVQHCGNGARCLLRFVHDKGLATHQPVRVETLGGVLALSFEPDGRVAVDMGEPRFEPTRVPFDPAGLESRSEQGDTLWRELPPGGGELWFSALSMGNPHAVCRVDDLRSEEHTSELQSREKLVCRLLLDKKNSIHDIDNSLSINASFD